MLETTPENSMPEDSATPDWEGDARLAYLAAEDVRVAASLLYQAYQGDPLFMHVFNAYKDGYEQRLRAAIREELSGFWQAGQPMIGLYQGDTLEGVVCLSHIHSQQDTGRYWHWRLKMLLTAGYVSTKQMIEKERRIAEAVTYTDYLMVSFIAVHPRYQHRGLGQLLVRGVNSLLEDKPEAQGVVALATRPEYESFLHQQGFDPVCTIEVGAIQGALMALPRSE